MLKQILPVRRPVLHPPDHPHELALHVVDAEVDARPLADFLNLLVDFLRHFRHDFLDACGVNPTVRHELVQSESCNLPPHRIEAAEDDGFWGVVHDELDTRRCLEGPNVPSFTTDDPPLDVIVGDVEDRHAVFDRVLRRHALDGLDDDFLRVLVRLELRLVHDFLDLLLSEDFRVLNDLLFQGSLCLIGAHAADFLEQFHALDPVFLEFFAFRIEGFEPLLDFLFLTLQLTLAVFDAVLVLLEVVLLVPNFVLAALHFRCTFLRLSSVLFLHGEELFLRLENLLLLDVFPFLFRFGNDFFRAFFEEIGK